MDCCTLGGTSSCPVAKAESGWSCYTCGYVGPDGGFDKCEEGACPECGTVSGDGFGMAENDPRIKSRCFDKGWWFIG